MKKQILKIIILSAIIIFPFSSQAQTGPAPIGPAIGDPVTTAADGIGSAIMKFNAYVTFSFFPAVPTGQDSGNTGYAWFEYGTDPAVLNKNTYPQYGSSAQYDSFGNFSSSVGQLSASTAYHFRPCIQDTLGVKRCGSITTATTLPSGSTLPIVETTKHFGNTMRGKLNPNGTSSGSITRGFEYGTFYYNLDKTAGVGGTAQPLTCTNTCDSWAITLTPGTLYYWRFKATTSSGTTIYGAIHQIRTFGQNPYASSNALSVYTGPATGITDTTAIFSGSANPNGRITFGYFRYAPLTNPPIFCNDIYGSQMKATNDVGLGDGNYALTFTKTVLGLTPNTTYYYCAIASDKTQNVIGYGGVQQFTTKPCTTCAQASIQTKQASVVNTKSVWLNGFYNANVKVKTWFEYRKIVPPSPPNPADNPLLLDQAPVSNWSSPVGTQTHTPSTTVHSGPIKFLLTGLDSKFSYEFRAVIQDDDPYNKTYGLKIYGDTFAFNFDSLINVTPGDVPGGSGYNNNTNYSGYNSNPCPPTLPPPTLGGPISIGGGINLPPPPLPPPTFGGSIGINVNLLPPPIPPPPYIGGPISISTNINLPPPTLPPPSLGGPISIGTGIGVSSGFPCPPDGSGTSGSGTSGTGTNGTGTTGTGTSGTSGAGTSGGISFGGDGTAGGGVFGPSAGAGTGIGGVAPAPTVGSTVTPLSDAIVRNTEGVETVFARQIMNYPELAKLYGYQEGADLKTFADNLAHVLAQTFGYINTSGREIRVSIADLAAYEIGLKDSKLAIYEYYGNTLTGIRVATVVFKNAFSYEYYFNKR